METGDRQNTNRKPTGKKAKELSQDEQSERFLATAKSLGVDETGKMFEKTVSVVMPKATKKRK